MTKYYVTQSGKYVGAFDGALPPAGTIEVPYPPAHGADIWNGTAYTPAPLSVGEHNAPILAALAAIDAKSIRPLREGDTARVAALETEAAALRAQLLKGQ